MSFHTIKDDFSYEKKNYLQKNFMEFQKLDLNMIFDTL
jgi:hypothetical protein